MLGFVFVVFEFCEVEGIWVAVYVEVILIGVVLCVYVFVFAWAGGKWIVCSTIGEL